MATRFIPIPGSSITIEYVMQNLINVNGFNYFIPNISSIPKDFINNGILLYRSFVLYIPAILGLPFFIGFFFIDTIKFRKFSKLQRTK
jgi:uncharacterized membrane protein YbhN (UPF0104 family)